MPGAVPTDDLPDAAPSPTTGSNVPGAVPSADLPDHLDAPSLASSAAPVPAYAGRESKLPALYPGLDKAILQIENSGRLEAGVMGDNGAAFGSYQTHQGAIDDVNKRLGTNYTAQQARDNPQLSQLIGTTYAQMMQEEFKRPEYVLGAYNQGPGAMRAAIASGQGVAGLPKGGQDYVARGMKYANMSYESPGNPSLPYPDRPGEHRGTIYPFASDDNGNLIVTKSNWPVLYMPEFLRSPIRGAVAGGQEILGERPVDDPATRDDIFAATMLGAGGAPAAIVKTVAAPPSIEFKPITEFVSRITGEDISKNRGAQQIVKRMEQDQKAGGPTAQDMIDLLNQAPNKPQMPMDVGGKNTQGLAGKAYRAPGPGGQIIEKAIGDRDLNAGPRLSGDVDTGIGSGSSYDAATTLDESRKAAAKPAYDAAYGHPAINPDEMNPESGSIGTLMPRPSMRAGMANAMKIAAEEGRDPNTLGIDLNAQGEPVFTRVPSWQTLDYVKRGVDNVVEQYRDKTTGKLVLDTYGRAAEQTRYEFRNTLRTLNPKYGDALDTYSGPSTSLEALRAGQDFLKQRPEEISRRLATLGPGDKEFYKLGAADTLRTSLAKKGVSADETKAIIGSQYMRNQLRPLFDTPESYDKFIKSVQVEGRMFRTGYGVMGNSRTAGRLAEDETPELDAAGHVAKAATSGGLLERGSHLLNAIAAYGRKGDPAVNAQIARLLTTDMSEASVAARMKELKTLLDGIGPAPPRKVEYVGRASRALAPGSAALMSPSTANTAATALDTQ